MDENRRHEWQTRQAETKASGYRIERELDRMCKKMEDEHRARSPIWRWLFSRLVDVETAKRSTMRRIRLWFP